MLHCICFGLRFARPNAWMNWDELIMFCRCSCSSSCAVSAHWCWRRPSHERVMVYIHQLDGLLHHGATLSFDVAHEYYSPRSCLIACCPIVRGCHVPRQRISQALDDHRCDFSSKTLPSTRFWKGVNEHGFSSPWTPPSSSLAQAPG